MYFASVSDFITMDGHGAYVWAVYGVALVILGSLAIAPMLNRRRFVKEELQRMRRESQIGGQSGGQLDAQLDKGRG